MDHNNDSSFLDKHDHSLSRRNELFLCVIRAFSLKTKDFSCEEFSERIKEEYHKFA